MLLQLAGLVDTRDVNEWENEFLKNVLRDSEDGARTSKLSAKRLEHIEELFTKHFAG